MALFVSSTFQIYVEDIQKHEKFIIEKGCVADSQERIATCWIRRLSLDSAKKVKPD